MQEWSHRAHKKWDWRTECPYLAGVGPRNEQFQSLSLQLHQPSIAVLTPNHSLTPWRTPAARGRRPRPKTRGAAERPRWPSADPWGNGSWRSREGSRWGDPRAWRRGAGGAGHGASTLRGRACAGAGGFLVGLAVPCVREKRCRFCWRCVRHLGEK